MVPDSSLSRRQLLASGGVTGTLLGGGYLARQYLRTAAGAQTAVGGASGWPMAARDPGGTAYAPDADPPIDGISVRWRRDILSGSEADERPAPVVADGVVYAVGPFGSEDVPVSPELLAVSASDGDVLARGRRSTRTAAAVAPARAYREPTVATLETPTFDAHRLVGLPARGGRSGWWQGDDATRWTASTDADADSYSRVHFGGSTTPPPVVAGDTLLTYVRGTLAVVDGSGGAVRWTSDEGLPAVRPAVRDGTAYVVGPEGGVRGYDLATGDHTTVRRAFPASPMYLTATAERLFVSGQGWIQALDTDGSVAWRTSFEGEDVPAGPLAVGDGTVYARRPADRGTESEGETETDGGTEPLARLCALDAADGSLQWVADGVAVETGPFLPAVADGLVAVPTADGALAGVDAADGSVRWRFDSPAEPCSPAALVDDAVYVVASAQLYALEEA
ncbi:Pyrrolo-quinoline quinone repeat-containing protein [Halosimplex carlsbadense 2-9-1]|uniref:Pyrrolo-quinoline quinone repeat-containing protein n=1 Tax=Halosimplex carlsbadense 2-9-1 TaxID=797114 RepID=M0CQY0_9EURY|nr:PQQ-binding-like beta-propeller repeat protein [Halosimplex carlsbadense]ELZ25665.1 Pyrrolo-quinoline quinone repeat-containing protein [Halosimplex carlsbadense 2-9-1]